LARSNAIKPVAANWTVDDLDQFLANPKVAASVTKATYAGARDLGKRADMIEYLRILSDHPRRVSAK
jgi:cytochrome c2